MKFKLKLLGLEDLTTLHPDALMNYEDEECSPVQDCIIECLSESFLINLLNGHGMQYSLKKIGSGRSDYSLPEDIDELVEDLEEVSVGCDTCSNMVPKNLSRHFSHDLYGDGITCVYCDHDVAKESDRYK